MFHKNMFVTDSYAIRLEHVFSYLYSGVVYNLYLFIINIGGLQAYSYNFDRKQNY